MAYLGYDFYFKIGSRLLTLPITPPDLKIKIGSNNKVVTLINEGDINILKSPSLTEFKFEARFPMRKYPYSRDPLPFENYLNTFTTLKTEKTPFVFSVVRRTPNGKGTWGTSRKVSLEELEVKESVEEGDDVLITFTLKEYKDYGVKKIKVPSLPPITTSTSNKSRGTDNKNTASQNYTIKSGDCLWNISKRFYGSGAKWKTIYEANKTVIENTAKKYRNGKGSSNGHWIYPGTKITIPGVKVANANTQKINNKKLATMESKLDAIKTRQASKGGGGTSSGEGAGRR